MELSMIILKQIVLMFIYMMIGFLLYKKKFVTKQGSKELGLILLYVILPVVIVKAYLVTFSAELLRGLALSFAASLLVLLLSMLLSRIVFRSKYPIEQFSSAFSNAGFIGIPLVEMTFNDSMAVFYVSSFVAWLNILQWTYGIVVMTGKRDSIAPKKDHHKSHSDQLYRGDHPVFPSGGTAGGIKQRSGSGLVHERAGGDDHPRNLSGADEVEGTVYR